MVTIKKEYKIAITGSHSTGKTTLARALSQVLEIPYTNRDKAISIAHKIAPGKTMEQLSAKEHWKIQLEILKGYEKMLNETRCFVSDASVFTWEAYTKLFVKDDNLKKISQYIQCKDVLTELKKKYTHVFYLPPEIPLEFDGFRPQSNVSRLDIDKLILKELSGTQYFTLTGSVADRIKMAQDILRK